MRGEASTAEETTDETNASAELALSRVPVVLPPKPGAVLFIEAGHSHCRWPLWEGEVEAKFVCGSPRRSASTSYCCEHWVASGGARPGRPPSARFLGRESRAVSRERLDLVTLQRREGF